MLLPLYLRYAFASRLGGPQSVFYDVKMIKRLILRGLELRPHCHPAVPTALSLFPYNNKMHFFSFLRGETGPAAPAPDGI
jgi:hypothetical protein